MSLTLMKNPPLKITNFNRTISKLSAEDLDSIELKLPDGRTVTHNIIDNLCEYMETDVTNLDHTLVEKVETTKDSTKVVVIELMPIPISG